MSNVRQSQSINAEYVFYSTPLINKKGSQRAIITNKHNPNNANMKKDYVFHIAIIDEENPEKSPDIELSFTVEEVDALSEAVFSGDTDVLKEKGLIRKLAAVCRFALYEADYRLMRPHEDAPIMIHVNPDLER